MKNIILIITLLCTAITITQAQDKYAEGMEKAFEFWTADKEGDAVALFERIGQAEKEKWHPLYHATNVLISQSFKAKDATDKMMFLEKARIAIAAAHERSPDNDEILTLEGLLYTSYVAMDPATYAMKYSQKIMALHEKALTINPENPRALANKIEYEMGTARFFKQDLTPFCEKLQEILPKFDKESDDPFAPSYGKERVESIIENCGA